MRDITCITLTFALTGQFGGKKLQAMGRQNAVVSKARDVQKEAAKIGKQATDAKPPPKL